MIVSGMNNVYHGFGGRIASSSGKIISMNFSKFDFKCKIFRYRSDITSISYFQIFYPADCFWDWIRCDKKLLTLSSKYQHCITRFEMCIDTISVSSLRTTDVSTTTATTISTQTISILESSETTKYKNVHIIEVG